MTKKEFLNTLNENLKCLPPNVLANILFDYQDYFNSKDPSISEEDLVATLGDPDIIIKNYKEQYMSIATDIIEPTFESVSTDDFIKDNTFIQDEDFFEENKENSFKEDFNSNYGEDKNETNYSKKSKPKFRLPKFRSSSLPLILMLPIALLLLPIGFGLGASTFFICISLVIFIFSGSALLLSTSVASLCLSFAGVAFLIGRNFADVTLSEIPSFISEFPSSFIIFLTLSALSLAICFFMLFISYSKFAFRTIKFSGKSAFKFIFLTEGSIDEEKI